MHHHPNISIPNAYEIYNGKRVLLRVQTGPEITEYIGSFLVSPISNWMRIEVKLQKDQATVILYELDQAVAESIQPIPTEAADALKGLADFLIPTPLVLPPQSK
jgi:hypothetical protein